MTQAKLSPDQHMQAIREWVRQGGMPDFARPDMVKLAPLTDLDGLRDDVAEIQARHVVSEQPFTSVVPVLGPLIVGVRTAWNWIATKWYVLPIVKQQNDFNGSVARSWNDLLNYLKYVVFFARDVSRRLDLLERSVDELEDGETGQDFTRLPPMPAVMRKEIVKTVLLSYGDLLTRGPVLVLAKERGEITDILTSGGIEVYHPDVAFATQEETGNDFHGGATDTINVLRALPAGDLKGLFLLQDTVSPLKTTVCLLDECRRLLSLGAWMVWVWPWSVYACERALQEARHVALGMGFRTVRLSVEQYQGLTYQSLVLQK